MAGDVHPSKEPPRNRRRGVTVLHVDDDPRITDLSAKLLTRKDESIEVISEPRPRDGLERLHRNKIDCVVSDYQMPGLDGIEFLRAVREKYPDIPFILFTGKGSEEVASEAISAGVTNYLQKGRGTDQYSVLAKQIQNEVSRRRVLERYERFLESAPDAIVVVDATGGIRQVNDRALELFGYRREELVGNRIEKLLPERFREDHVQHRDTYIEEPETRPMGADLELFALQKDGSEFPVDISISPMQIGGELEVMAAVRDISSRKWREKQLRKREEEIERQNQRLDEFASVVSHDLRNPLLAAEGNLELARETGDPEFFDNVANAHNRIESLIDDLLTLAREGQEVGENEQISLAAVARDAWRTVPADDASIEISADKTVSANRTRLKQAFENIFRNAVEHGGDDVTIKIQAADDRFWVEDDGSGFAADDQNRVFNQGYSTQDLGTGLGLSIVRRIVQAHGWEIRAEEGTDGGARLLITGVEFDPEY